MTKVCNFPGRKNERRAMALMRTLDSTTRTNTEKNIGRDAAKGKTKKHGGKLARQAAWRIKHG